MRARLAAYEIGTLCQVLGANGWSRRWIARATKAQQSEISAIVKGRQILGYDVLVRITEGLGIPRERMGLSFGAYAGEVTTAEPSKGVHEDVLRRYFQRLLALGAIAACGPQIERIGELAPGLAAPVDLPSRIGTVDVARHALLAALYTIAGWLPARVACLERSLAVLLWCAMRRRSVC